MRNVERAEQPASLRDNAEIWLNELNAALAANDQIAIKRISNNYKQSDVLSALKAMYKGLCCYCESRIVTIAYEEIEHRLPKKVFRELTFAWENLHLSCPKCNRSKSSKHNPDAPILDPVSDVPISDHLDYDLQIGEKTGYLREAKTPNGATTIEIANLNREELNNARLKVYAEVERLLKMMAGNRNAPNMPNLLLRLGDLETGEYGSIITDRRKYYQI